MSSRSLFVVASILLALGCSPSRTVPGRTQSLAPAIAGDALGPVLVLSQRTDQATTARSAELRARVSTAAQACGLRLPDGREVALESDAAGFSLDLTDEKADAFPLGAYTFEARAADGSRKSATVHAEGAWPATPALTDPEPGELVSSQGFDVRFTIEGSPELELAILDDAIGHLLQEMDVPPGATTLHVPRGSVTRGQALRLELRAFTASRRTGARLESAAVVRVAVGD